VDHNVIVMVRTAKKLELCSPVNFPHGFLEGRSWQKCKTTVQSRWRIGDLVIIFMMELETCLIVLNNRRPKSWWYIAAHDLHVTSCANISSGCTTRFACSGTTVNITLGV